MKEDEPKTHKEDGREEHHWKEREDHRTQEDRLRCNHFVATEEALRINLQTDPNKAANIQFLPLLSWKMNVNL